ncbi:helix-turn-helix domain-containing protein [Aliivibrio fischeri]|uniref:Helix-turn-helix domain-containing protein n=1 Tax=Aliivibrio fischeri TaxID=668 RepID=A0A510UFT8_ALIFS|nr:AraC family transcriptional regulator [Aliivibrio fischeri]MUK47942.1 helix-turn-helix domain-containing protein [Aliivibrio fischeri]MUK64375.1 helix-turn-helix domain-containing protein [Aliivibrio fischeri]MUK69072.1 helix-turn-helix domain-containing protein [Aliivibrio fischeri]MUK71893.1 helix-turn-helix domain-containing protein [Aliivibrio fischeri]MUL15739.1 helix-turn-helix domain-containing protein [Aliivibrio fischeri]
MLHWLKIPQSPIVAQYIECYWTIEKTAKTNLNDFPKLNPDPATHLVLSPSEQPFIYKVDDTAITGKGSHWLYPHRNTFQLDHSQPFIHLGIKFRTGALYSLTLPNYEHPTLDDVHELKNNIPIQQQDISNLIEMAKNNVDMCCQKLDELLIPWLIKSKQDRHSELVKKALSLLDSISINELSEKLFCSQRTLERSFIRVTGLTLKQCQSMNKLEVILEYLYQRDADDIDWAEIAVMFGFSDQPHLIRYLKNQIGLTPKTYEKERGLTIDVYGGVDSL